MSQIFLEKQIHCNAPVLEQALVDDVENDKLSKNDAHMEISCINIIHVFQPCPWHPLGWSGPIVTFTVSIQGRQKKEIKYIQTHKKRSTSWIQNSPLRCSWNISLEY